MCGLSHPWAKAEVDTPMFTTEIYVSTLEGNDTKGNRGKSYIHWVPGMASMRDIHGYESRVSRVSNRRITEVYQHEIHDPSEGVVRQRPLCTYSKKAVVLMIQQAGAVRHEAHE